MKGIEIDASPIVYNPNENILLAYLTIIDFDFVFYKKKKSKNDGNDGEPFEKSATCLDYINDYFDLNEKSELENPEMLLNSYPGMFSHLMELQFKRRIAFLRKICSFIFHKLTLSELKYPIL